MKRGLSEAARNGLQKQAADPPWPRKSRKAVKGLRRSRGKGPRAGGLAGVYRAAGSSASGRSSPSSTPGHVRPRCMPKTSVIYEKDGHHRIRFDVPVDAASRRVKTCDLRLSDERRVKNTGRRQANCAGSSKPNSASARSGVAGADHAHQPHRHGRAHAARPRNDQGAGSSSIRAAPSCCRARCMGSAMENVYEDRAAHPQCEALFAPPHHRGGGGRGHEIVPVDYLRCYMNITSRRPELRYQGRTSSPGSMPSSRASPPRTPSTGSPCCGNSR